MFSTGYGSKLNQGTAGFSPCLFHFGYLFLMNWCPCFSWFPGIWVQVTPDLHAIGGALFTSSPERQHGTDERSIAVRPFYYGDAVRLPKIAGMSLLIWLPCPSRGSFLVGSSSKGSLILFNVLALCACFSVQPLLASCCFLWVLPTFYL